MQLSCGTRELTFNLNLPYFVGWLACCFTSQSTAMVMLGRSVHLTTLFLGKLDQAVYQYFVQILSVVTDNNPYLISRREENSRRNYFMINLQESMGPCQDRTRDPGSAVRDPSAVRRDIDCTTRLVIPYLMYLSRKGF